MIFKLTHCLIHSTGDQIAPSVFADERDEVELEPLLCEPIIYLLKERITDQGVVEWFQTIGMSFTFTSMISENG